MTPEAKAKWIADLESGRYYKTNSILKSTHGYCCLGVLIETQGPGFFDVPATPLVGDDDKVGVYRPKSGPEGMAVQNGEELSQFGRKLFGISQSQMDDLTQMNDNSETFTPVIDLIKGMDLEYDPTDERDFLARDRGADDEDNEA